MALARFSSILVGISLAAAACSGVNDDAGPDPAADNGPTTSLEGAETTATFRDEPVVDGRLTEAFLSGTVEEQIADFLASPNSGKGAQLAANMAEDGDLRWVPWLLDLHRLAQSSRVDKEAITALEQLSGLESGRNRAEDFRIFGGWAQTLEIEPGDGYREWKLGLYGIIDAEFAVLLDTVESDQLLTEIHWGGVTRGGIPELNDPVRLPASEADWMTPDELVLGVEFGETPVAYPVRILGHHELANDTVDGVPVSIVYCTLCRTGLAFDRRLTAGTGDEVVLDFQTSGLLWSSNKIMVDNQTDTLWQHLSGTGIGGELEGAILTQLPLVTTTWADWVAEHPDTETLDFPDPVFFPETPERPPIAYDYDPAGAYQSYYENPDVWFPILDTPNTVPLKTPVLGLAFDGESLAVVVEDLEAFGPRVFQVGDQTVLAVPTVGGARVYDATDTGFSDGDAPTLVSQDPNQVEVEGGLVLERLVVPQAFWFAWFGDHQDTAIWPTDG